MERPRRDAVRAPGRVVGRDEPELVEPVRARVAQASMSSSTSRPTGVTRTAAVDVDALAGRAAQREPLRRPAPANSSTMAAPRPRRPAAPRASASAPTGAARGGRGAATRSSRPGGTSNGGAARSSSRVRAAQLVRRRGGSRRSPQVRLERRASSASSCPSAHSTRSGCSAIEAPLAQRVAHRAQGVEGAGLDRAERHVELARRSRPASGPRRRSAPAPRGGRGQGHHRVPDRDREQDLVRAGVEGRRCPRAPARTRARTGGAGDRRRPAARS